MKIMNINKITWAVGVGKKNIEQMKLFVFALKCTQTYQKQMQNKIAMSPMEVWWQNK